MGNNTGKEIICSGEKLLLTSLKAAYWPARNTLILADLHLGKSAYFRNNGIAIPSTVMTGDLERLSYLIHSFNTEKLIVVGDMFHHSYNADVNLFKEWRAHYQMLEIELVPGNHDKLLKLDYQLLQINVTSERHFVAPFFFEHAPTAASNGNFTISGHLHPGYLMEGKARQALRLPCFIKSEQHLVLPSFSAFTGLNTNYEKKEGNSYFVIGANKVYCI